MLLWFFVAVSVVQYAVHQPERYQSWMKHNKGKLCYAAIALIAFCLMLCCVKDEPFRVDELIQTVFKEGGISYSIQNCLNLTDGSPPLHAIWSSICYKVLPHSELWLMLPSILLTITDIYVAGLIGEELKGRLCGILSACLLAFSVTVWGYVAFDFHNYALYLMFSMLSLYCHMKKLEKDGRWQIYYSLSLLGLAMSHYFGMLIYGLYFLSDIYLFFRKEVSWKTGIAYILPGAVSLLWLGMVYCTVQQRGGMGSTFSWYSIPNLQAIKNLIYWLSGKYIVSFILLALGMACAMVQILHKDSGRDKQQKFYMAFSLLQLVVIIGVVYLYGNYINRINTMWEARYFVGLIPFALLLSASSVISLLPKGDVSQMLRVETVVIAICIAVVGHNLTADRPYKPYESWRDAADWLYTQRDYIFNANTVVVTSAGGWEKDQWQNHYISRFGRRDPLHLLGQYELTKEQLLSYNKVYLYRQVYDIDTWLQSALDENYNLEMDIPDIQIRVYTRK